MHFWRNNCSNILILSSFHKSCRFFILQKDSHAVLLRRGCLSQFSKIVPIKTAYLRYAVCGCCLCIKNANCYESGLAVCAVFAHFSKPAVILHNKTKTHADSHRINVRSHGRSGETRTRGLLLPKQARYQLRNTPASGGTAIPPEYSISFFARFVNTESAAGGTARSAFFQPAEAAAGSSGKGRGSRRFLWEPGAGLVQLPKSRCKNYT